MKKRALLFLGFVFCLSSGLFAEETTLLSNLKEILPESVAVELLEKGQLEHVMIKEKNPQYRFVPNTPLGKEAVDFWDRDTAPSFIDEVLFLYKKPALAAPGADIERISGIFRSISTLEGIPYYSKSKKKELILYEYSYVIDDPSTQNKIPDPTAESVDGQVLYALQKDATFGETIYRYRYRQAGVEVAFFAQNLTPFYVAFIRALKAEGLKMVFVVDDIGEAFVMYGVIRADIINFPGVMDRVQMSFSSRADAVYRWFISQFEK
ncbi:MAG: hypothetical protein LBR47_03485 [Spirochaetaceae bacterium]|nr:hypothetical protein [Spirochaetaceae bacterium]